MQIFWGAGEGGGGVHPRVPLQLTASSKNLAVVLPRSLIVSLPPLSEGGGGNEISKNVVKGGGEWIFEKSKGET